MFTSSKEQVHAADQAAYPEVTIQRFVGHSSMGLLCHPAVLKTSHKDPCDSKGYTHTHTPSNHNEKVPVSTSATSGLGLGAICPATAHIVFEDFHFLLRTGPTSYTTCHSSRSPLHQKHHGPPRHLLHCSGAFSCSSSHSGFQTPASTAKRQAH